MTRSHESNRGLSVDFGQRPWTAWTTTRDVSHIKHNHLAAVADSKIELTLNDVQCHKIAQRPCQNGTLTELAHEEQFTRNGLNANGHRATFEVSSSNKKHTIVGWRAACNFISPRNHSVRARQSRRSEPAACCPP